LLPLPLAASRAPLLRVEPAQVPYEENGLSNSAVKYTVCWSWPAQKPPSCTLPSRVWSPITRMSESSTGMLAWPVLNRTLCAVPVGKV